MTAGRLASGGNFALAAALGLAFECRQFRHLEGRHLGAASGQIAAEGLATFVHVFDFRAVVRRPVKGCVGDGVVGDGNVKAIAESFESVFAHLFLHI